jgi:hypothetical protein
MPHRPARRRSAGAAIDNFDGMGEGLMDCQDNISRAEFEAALFRQEHRLFYIIYNFFSSELNTR